MRLAVVSDIHGNLTALEAVAADVGRRDVDQVVHGGDVALIGARPAEVIDRLTELGWRGILGNPDELLWRPEQFAVQLRAAPKLEPLLRLLFENYASATLERIGEARVGALRKLPESRSVAGVGLVHASPGDLWRAPMAEGSVHTMRRMSFTQEMKRLGKAGEGVDAGACREAVGVPLTGAREISGRAAGRCTPGGRSL